MNIMEILTNYVSHLSDTPLNAPIWVIIVSLLLLRALTRLDKSVMKAIRMLKWLNDKMNEVTNKLFKKKVTNQNITIPVGYELTGTYIIGSNGEKFPEYRKI